jgi:hypothetical protein
VNFLRLTLTAVDSGPILPRNMVHGSFTRSAHATAIVAAAAMCMSSMCMCLPVGECLRAGTTEPMR